MIELAEEMVNIAKENNLTVETCAEQIDLCPLGIEHGSCIDRSLIEKIIGCELKGKRIKIKERSVDVSKVWKSVPMIPVKMDVDIVMPILTGKG